MQRTEIPQTEQYAERGRSRRVWRRTVGAMACAVILCMAYFLSRPASTLETACGLEEHTHTDACYEEVKTERRTLVCTPETLGIHQHTEECYDSERNLTCGYADFVAHTHEEACYDEEGNLVCQLPEIEGHVHTEECYADSSEAGHTHDESCYTAVRGDLLCQLPEDEEHQHTDACYEQRQELACGLEESAGNAGQELICGKEGLHTHGPECYDETNTLICGQLQIEEHIHDDSCFQSVEETKRELVCGLEEHVHDGSCLPEEASANVLAGEVYSGECGDNAEWTLSGGVLTISGTGEMEDEAFGDWTPWADYRDQIHTVVVEEGITHIGDSAFEDIQALTAVTLPSTVTSIGDGAFAGDSSLAEISLPENLEMIDRDAFEDCTSLKEIVLPEALTELAAYAFEGCTALEKVTLNTKALTSVGTLPFYQCSGLKTLVIGDTVDVVTYGFLNGVNYQKSITEVQYEASNEFTYSGSEYTLCGISFADGVKCTVDAKGDLELSLDPVSGTDGSITWEVADDVLTISGTGAMKDYWSASADETPWYQYREYFHSVKVTGGVTRLGDYSFYQYTGLTGADLSEASQMTEIGSSAFQGCTSLAEVSFPDRLETIESSAFRSCTSLAEALFPDGLSQIGSYAFRDCSNLSKITLPEKLTSLMTYAFRDCTSLKELRLLSTALEDIRSGAFDDSALNKLVIGKPVDVIYADLLDELNEKGTITEVVFEGPNEFQFSGTEKADLGGYSLYPGFTYIVDEKGALSVEGYSGTCEGGVEWSVTPDGVLTLSGEGALPGTGDPTTDTQPWSNYKELITTVKIGAGVSNIHSTAFTGIPNLAEISIDAKNSDYKVEDKIVYSADGQTLIFCPPKAGRSDVTISGTVKKVEAGAFAGCTDLKKLVIEAPETEIGMMAFGGSGVESVTLPDGCTEVGAGWFLSCTSLKTINLPDTVTSIGASAFQFSGLESITLPDSVTVLGEGAFAYCSNLTKAVLPKGMTTVGASAFAFCSSLADVTLPESLTSIAAGAFGYCSSLTDITLPEGVTSIGDSAFLRCSSLASIQLPASLTSIGAQAFAYSGLQRAELPEGLEEIGASAFAYCSQLEHVTLPQNLRKMDAGAFGSCTSLAEVQMNAADITEIGAKPFSGGDIKTVTVGRTVNTLGDFLFSTSGQPSKLIFEGENDFTYTGATRTAAGITLYNGMSYHVDAKGNLTRQEVSGKCGENLTWTLAPDGTLTIAGQGAMYDYDSSKNPAPWKKYSTGGDGGLITSVKIEDGVTSIGDDAFYGLYALASVEIADSVTGIGDYAFYNCMKLGDIKLPEKLETLGIRAFMYASALKEITIPGSLKNIGDYAFANCTGLTSVTLEEGLSTIGKSMFERCTGLKSITIPGSVKTVGNYAFNYSGVQTAVLQEGVESLGNSAFNYCEELASVTLPDSLLSIGSSAFAHSALRKIDIPDQVTEIAGGAFAYNDNLEEITIGQSVSKIGASAFRDCAVLKTVILETQKLSSGAVDFYTFYGSSGIKELVICETVKEIDRSALNYIITSGKKDAKMSFRGPNTFTYTGADYVIGSLTLSAGQYEVDGNGNLISRGTCENGLSWVIGADGTLTISGQGEMADFNSRAPWYRYRTMIKEAVVEDGVKSLGNYAFYGCENLVSAQVADSVQDIGTSVFSGCSSLTEVSIPEGVPVLDENVFRGCTSLQNVNIPSSVTEIGRKAFSESGLTEITVPETVNKMGYMPFDGCASLKSITWNASEISTSWNTVLSGCTSLKIFTVGDTVDTLSYSILSKVPETATLEFKGPNEFIYTGSEVTVGGQTLSEGSYMVDSEGNLVRGGRCGENLIWTLDETGKLKITGSGEMTDYGHPIINRDQRAPWYQNIDEITEVELEAGVTSIGSYAFYGCTKLSKVTIPEESQLKTIGSSAFRECTALQEITLPKEIAEIDSYAFDGCEKLEKVTIQEGSQLQTVGSYAFSETALKTFTVPAGLTELSSGMFANCSSLTGVDFEEGSALKEIGYWAFQGTGLQKIRIPAAVEEIGGSAFRGCENLESVTFENDSSLKSIGSYAFYGSGLKEIEIPANVTELGEYAFYETNIREAAIPSGVDEIPRCAFAANPLLEKITIGSGVKNIDVYAFGGCTGLKTLVLDTAETPDIYNAQVFHNTSIDAIVIGKNVDQLTYDFMKLIGGDPSRLTDIRFEGPNEFTYTGKDYLIHTDHGDVLLTEGITYYSDGNGKLYLKGSFGDGVTWSLKDGTLKIEGSGAMEDYTEAFMNKIPWNSFSETITRIEIGKDITHVGDYVFSYCPNLEEIQFEEGSSLTSIGDYAFAGDKPLASVTLPVNENMTLGKGAFENCTNLASVNGETSLSEIEAMWPQKPDTFYNTALWGSITEAEDVIEGTESSERKITLGAAGEKNVLTGETIQTALTIDQGDGPSQDKIRVYFAFDSGYGSLSYEVGSYTFDGVQVDVCESDVPNVYYLEVPKVPAGATLNLNVDMLYKNLSPGGSALVWMSFLGEEEAKETGNGITVPEKVFRFNWETEPLTFPVSKTVNETPVLTGDGTEEGEVSIKNLSYSIKMTAASSGSSSYGKDIMKEARFEDTLELPEGFSWRPEIVEAVKEGNVTVTRLSNMLRVEAKAGGETYRLCTITTTSLYPYAVDDNSARLDEDGNLVISWRCTNTSATTEMPAVTATVKYGDGQIVPDETVTEQVKEAEEPLKFEFKNSVKVTQDFAFSDDVTEEDDASATATVSQVDYRITKSAIKISTAAIMGDTYPYEITLSNGSMLPYHELSYVEDPLSDYFYISPANMKQMLCEDDYGEDLTITLTNATLCKVVNKEVTGTDGETYDLTQQHAGEVSPDYTVKDLKEDPNITASGVTLTFSREEDSSNIKMTVSGAEDSVENTEYTIGSGQQYPDIQSALNEIGYIVDQDVQYTCRWDQKGQTLYSGEVREFQVRATLKDSFMYLAQDQPWFIAENANYVSGVVNTAKAVNASEEEKPASASAINIRKDYDFFKYVYLGDKQQDENEPAAIADGDVLRYRLDVERASAYNGELKILPLTDRMSGAQALLAKVAENPDLGQYGLERTTEDGIEYYVLDKVGTYENVTLGDVRDYIADSITVTKAEGGLETLIHWYLPLKNRTGYDIYFPVKVIGELAGENATSYSLNNWAWLNDHQTHRLYDDVFTEGKRVLIEKKIVTNMEGEPLSGLASHDYTKDEWAGHTTLTEGAVVTYRLDLERVGTWEGDVQGSSLRDYLPASLENYWNKDNVSVAYVATTGTQMTVSNATEDGWSIEKENGQQVLCWNDDFKITLNGEVYIYVTLTFPSGDKWKDYTHSYGSSEIKNTFMLDKMQDEVFHDVQADAGALLQKGVYRTGVTSRGNSFYVTYLPSTETGSLSSYTNDGASLGTVTYYITVANSGDSRLYLSGIQDVLPKGFTFDRFYSTKTTISDDTNSNETYYNSLIQVGDGTEYTYKKAYLEAETAENGVVTFHLSNSGKIGDLAFDSERNMYYLRTGEAVVIAYNCSTNGYEDTEDSAKNTAAMPYYAYNGAAFTLDTETGVAQKNLAGMTANDGDRTELNSNQAGALGMDTSGTGASTTWLTSEVTVKRGSIAPGLTKTAVSPFAGVRDIVTWNIQASNNGRETMRDYTLTDTMMAPYQFTGDVDYHLQQNGSDAVNASGTLFTIGERSKNDTAVTIYCNDDEKQLSVNGGAVTLQPRLQLGGSTRRSRITIQVSLTRDADGNETLSISFPTPETEETTEAAAIMPGGFARLTLRTKNFTNQFSNTTYYNSSYLTPSEEQPFDRGSVTQGSYTLYQEKPSIYSEANVAVSYGYATTSDKSVTELESTGNETENTAASSEAKNYIVLEEKEHSFRYTLKVNNTGGDSKSMAMDQLVILDNLPQKNDHATFYEEIQRLSEFQVDFADDLNFSVQVNGRELKQGDYTLEFSTKTEFNTEDRKGMKAEGWSIYPGTGDVSEMRSFRLKIADTTGTKIPANAVVTVSFNAKVAESELSSVEPSMTAWNSFGYGYSLVSSGAMLEASPQKVGVKIASAPTLIKRLEDSYGKAYTAPEDTVFRFLIYEGTAVEFPDLKPETIAESLKPDNRSFTLAELKVPKGNSESGVLELKDIKKYAYADGKFNETNEAWNWVNLAPYTILELPGEGAEEDYVFGSFNGSGANNQTFYYQSDATLNLSCTNVRNLWTLQLFKRDADNQNLALKDAVFAIYSKNEADQISGLGKIWKTVKNLTSAEDEIVVDGTTWYLMDVQETDETNGLIEWSGLTEDSYYILELKAPDGYNTNENPGQIVTAPADKEVLRPVTVLNEGGYEMPETGGPGPGGYLIGGTALMTGALLCGVIRRRKGERK